MLVCNYCIVCMHKPQMWNSTKYIYAGWNFPQLSMIMTLSSVFRNTNMLWLYILLITFCAAGAYRVPQNVISLCSGGGIRNFDVLSYRAGFRWEKMDSNILPRKYSNMRIIFERSVSLHTVFYKTPPPVFTVTATLNYVFFEVERRHAHAKQRDRLLLFNVTTISFISIIVK